MSKAPIWATAIIFLSLTFISCNFIKNEKNSKELKNKVQVQSASDQIHKQSKDISKRVIVIDPGHANRSNLGKEPISPESKEMKIKDGGGAEGVNTGTPEYEINMNVSMKLKKILYTKGYIVKMTKYNNSKSLGNVERAEIGNKENAALVIRIHADSSESKDAKGASMLVPSSTNSNTTPIYEQSKNYGKIILNTLVNEVGMPNRGVIEREDMTGFNWSKVPVVLVEMGFLSNPEEEELLCSQSYQEKLANALADGIDYVFR